MQKPFFFAARIAVFGFMMLVVSAAHADKYDAIFAKTASIDFSLLSKTFNQNGVKLEYVSNGYDVTKADAIRVTVNGKTKTIPGIFDPKNAELASGINCYKAELKNDPSLPKSSLWGRCFRMFTGFYRVSPSGYYVEYGVTGWEYFGMVLADLSNGKEVIAVPYPTLTGWTPDKKRYVYAQGSEFSGDAGLYATIPGKFPAVQKLVSDFVHSALFSGDYAFTIGAKIEQNGSETLTRRITKLSTGKSLYASAGKTKAVPQSANSISQADYVRARSKAEALGAEQSQSSEKQTTSIAQEAYKAKYVAPNDYGSDTDKIIVTISGKTYTLPGVYGNTERTKFLSAIKSGKCKATGASDDVLVGGKKYASPSNADCAVAKRRFANFIGFSPSGYYLLYSVSGYESAVSRMVDVQNGKVMIETEDVMDRHIWTPDRKQFAYAIDAGMGPAGPALYVTKRGAFPETVLLDKREVQGMYADSEFLYVLYVDSSRKGGNTMSIYSLQSLKLVDKED